MRIAIDHLTKTFGRLPALDQVTLAIEPGQTVAVVGANGAGKTTLLNCLGAVVAPTRGRILFDGELFVRRRVDLRQRLFLLPDFPFVYPRYTPIQHIGMTLRLYGREDPSLEGRVMELMREFDLLPVAESRLGDLSRGQVYKAALVAALAADPELWMLDEPFASGMDPKGLTAFKHHVRGAVERGRTVLYTTQLLDLAESFSNQVCILHKGADRAFDQVASLRGARTEPAGVLESLFQSLDESSP